MENKERVIAYDLGTGGLKASLFDSKGVVQASCFVSYETIYLNVHFQEQAPENWWQAIVTATGRLITDSGVDPDSIKALAISGHSLGVVPMGDSGELLRQTTPIWSDMRAKEQADDFFRKISYQEWYMSTGSGFPAQNYSIFKIMWYKDNEPLMYKRIYKVLGTKDYCNYRFTGRMCTDYSYASGSGVYDLEKWEYNDEYIKVSGINPDILPEIIASDDVVGEITPDAAMQTGLASGTRIICGGVDNSCMALGAKGIKSSRIYTSLGSSAWIALISDRPVVDFSTKPYVFAHVIKGLYTSATCIFSAGNALQWVRNTMFSNLVNQEIANGTDAYDAMTTLAEKDSVVGARGVLFNPSLAGGSMMEPSPDICGAFTGLRLSHNNADIARGTLEGITLNLRVALDILMKYCSAEKMLIVGGGAKSDFWMKIFADIYNMTIEKSNIDQQAASLGAAALALKGIGLWNGYGIIDTIHITQKEYIPQRDNVELYNKQLSKFKRLTVLLAQLSDDS